MARKPRQITPRRVTIANTGQVIDCLPTQTILHAALAAGIDRSEERRVGKECA